MAQCQGPRAQIVRHLFALLLYLVERCCKNPQSTRDPTQLKFGLNNNMQISIVGLTIYHTTFQ